nr:MAG TPA: hypothetical protein [Crassvirales sp.]
MTTYDTLSTYPVAICVRVVYFLHVIVISFSVLSSSYITFSLLI